MPVTPQNVTKSEDNHSGPLKDYGKSRTNEPNTPSKSPPSKKRRVDAQSNDPIEAKLTEIRNNMETEDQSPKLENSNAHTPSKNKKNKNKKKNKVSKIKEEIESPDQTGSQQDFDYANVDFKKFGGGSITEQKNEIKMKFHGKVKTNIFFFNFFQWIIIKSNKQLFIIAGQE